MYGRKSGYGRYASVGKFAALRCGVSDLVLTAAPLLYESKIIIVLPSPQGHAKSLLDAVNTDAFASVLQGVLAKTPRKPTRQTAITIGAFTHFLASG